MENGRVFTGDKGRGRCGVWGGVGPNSVPAGSGTYGNHSIKALGRHTQEGSVTREVVQVGFMKLVSPKGNLARVATPEAYG